MSWAHPSGSRPLEDICTSSVAPGTFFDMRQENRLHPPAPEPIEVQIEQWKRSTLVGQRSRQAALPHPMMDGPVFSEVLQQLMEHDEAGAPVALLLSLGLFQGVSDCPGVGCSTLLVSTAYDIQPPWPRLLTHRHIDTHTQSRTYIRTRKAIKETHSNIVKEEQE